MLSLEESLKILKETKALIEGHFILSSGLHSSKYVQCAQLLSKPTKAVKICASLAEKVNSTIKNFDLILSPAMGGIVIGYEIGRILKKETIFSERVNGIFKLRRVPFRKSKKIKSASKKEIQSMLNLCIKNLDEINFFRPKEKRPKMLENLRNIFYKMDLSDKETRILSGVFGSLCKKR